LYAVDLIKALNVLSTFITAADEMYFIYHQITPAMTRDVYRATAGPGETFSRGPSGKKILEIF